MMPMKSNKDDCKQLFNWKSFKNAIADRLADVILSLVILLLIGLYVFTKLYIAYH